MKIKALALALAFGTLGFASVASAAAVTVSCPGTAATSDREFSLTTDPGASCLLFGTGNISGNNDPVNLLGYVTLDKSDDAGSGAAPGSLIGALPTSGLSGTFSLATALLANYTNFVIAFKSGQGGLDPDWAAFALPAGVTSGSWAISGDQALSHANLYGQLAAVPLPAGVWLLLTVAGGLALTKRRRKDA